MDVTLYSKQTTPKYYTQFYLCGHLTIRSGHTISSSKQLRLTQTQDKFILSIFWQRKDELTVRDSSPYTSSPTVIFSLYSSATSYGFSTAARTSVSGLKVHYKCVYIFSLLPFEFMHRIYRVTVVPRKRVEDVTEESTSQALPMFMA